MDALHSIPAAAGVYVIVNTVNGKRYVGSSVNMWRRLRAHRNYLRAGNHHNKPLQNSWKKHGEGAFQILVLSLVTIEQGTAFLQSEEQAALDQAIATLGRENIYNICTEAVNTLKGVPRPQWVKDKIAAAHKGKPKSDQHKANLAIAKTGVKQSAEVIAERVRRMTGRKMSDESKKKLSLAKTGKPMSQYAKDRMVEAQAKIVKVWTPEMRKALSDRLKGRVFSEEHRQRISDGVRKAKPWENRVISDDERGRRSVAMKAAIAEKGKWMAGRKATDDARKNMSEAHKKRKSEGKMKTTSITPEHRAKMDDGHRKYMERKRKEDEEWQRILHAQPYDHL